MIPLALLLKANKERWGLGRVHPRDPTVVRTAIMCDGQVVGFYTPHLSARGERRLGPIYVLPEYRRRGLVSAIYRATHGPMLAAVEDGNEPSMALHLALGFVRAHRFRRGWYLRRA